MPDTNLQISTYNCRGLRGDKNRIRIFEWVRGKHQDIVFVQEAHSIKQDEEKWKREWKGNIIFSHGTTESRGVMILLKDNSNIDIVKVDIGRGDGRELYVKATVYGIEMLLVNIYAPNNDDPGFYERVFDAIRGFDVENIVMGGDMNLVLDVTIDKNGGRAQTNEKARECMVKHMEVLELVDIWRVKNPEKKEFTWRRRKPHIVQCRLDFFLLSQSVCNLTQYCRIGNSFLSDHSVVNLGLKLDMINRGPGFWKLNCSLLREREYLDKIKEVIHECELMYEESAINPIIFWETLKMNIRSETIKYSSAKKKERVKREKELENKIKLIEMNESSEENCESLEELKLELRDILDRKIEGSMIRSRVRMYEDDEKPSKYFLSLEKHKQGQKRISMLVDSEGNTLSKPEDVRKEIESFYKELYKQDQKEDETDSEEGSDEEFMDCITATLTEEERELCEGLISEKELLTALKESKNNKAPGIDGIPADMYKVLWRDISCHMLRALNSAYESGELSVNHRKGVISLIPKKDKDTILIKNWRPITLLCADYKLASKVISNRIKTHLPKLINCDQTGFVRGRYIGQNIDILLQIIENAENTDTPGIILGVDYAKAFDQLSWEYMVKVLGRYQFGNGLIRWIQLFFNNINAVVNVNGWFTGEIELQRGVKQGDPISPYLFILCAEVYAEYIRKCENVKGIWIGDYEHKISMLADDTNIFIQYCEQSLNCVLSSLDRFSKLSGLKINYDKSMAYNIGVKKQGYLKTKYPIKWKCDVIETLGVKIPLYDRSNIFDMNYDPKITAIENTIKSWASRNLSLRGKVTVIKSLLLSKLQYLVSVLGKPDQSVVRRIDKLVFKFLWNGSEKLKRKVVINNREEGGLEVPDFECICKCAMVRWVQRYVHSEEGSWKKIVDHTLRKVGGKLVFDCNIKKEDSRLKLINSSLWQKIVYTWCEMKYKESDVILLEDILWLNSNFTQTMYDRLCVRNGLLYVSQIYDGKVIRSLDEVNKMFKVSLNVIYYHNIVQSINKKFCTQRPQTDKDHEVNVLVQTILHKVKNKGIVKRIYKHLIGLKAECENVSEKWKNVLQINEDNNTLFTHIERTTIVNRLRSFQYKFLHRILYFNNKLFKCKISSTTLCDFCNQALDSIEHRYIYCDVTQRFFRDVNTMILQEYNIQCVINNAKNLVTNMYTDMPLVDTIVLNAKYYIYSCFIKKRTPSISYFKQIVVNVEKTEQILAEKKNALTYHRMKWCRFV